MSELECLRECGKIHRELKCELKEYIKPGMKAIDIANYIESQVNTKIGNSTSNHIMGGVAFPTGLSINDCAAHWTPEKDDTTIITSDDIIKVDFGIHRNGYIIDSAYTHSFDGKYEGLIEATKEANRVAIKNSGVDAILGEIGRDIKETIDSYEVTIKNKVYKLKPVRDLTGHSISRYKIHSSKSVPNIYISQYQERMVDGEIYAIEPFASTGKGTVYSDVNNCSHYMIENLNLRDIRLNDNDRDFLKNIYKNYLTLPFCTRWLDCKSIDYSALKNLADMKVVNNYPPLYDIKKSYISQHEHTVSVTEAGVEILS